MKFKAKNEHNPDGYEHFLTQKFDKKAVFRTILPYLAVAKVNTRLLSLGTLGIEGKVGCEATRMRCYKIDKNWL